MTSRDLEPVYATAASSTLPSVRTESTPSFEDLVTTHLHTLESIPATKPDGTYASYLFPDNLAVVIERRRIWDKKVEKARTSTRIKWLAKDRARTQASRRYWSMQESRRVLSRQVTYQACAAMTTIEAAVEVLTNSGARSEVLERVDAAVGYAHHLGETCSASYDDRSTKALQGTAAHRGLLVLAAEVQALVTLEMQREALVRELDSATMSRLATRTVDDIREVRTALSGDKDAVPAPVLSGPIPILSW